MFEITYTQTATVTTEFVTNLDPIDYLDFDTKEAVEAEIYDILADDVDYGDYNLDVVEDDNLEIPDEFWEEWERLKEEHDKE